MSSPNYNTFKELKLERRRRLLIVHFNSKWKLRTIYELLRLLDVANNDGDVAIIALVGNFKVGQIQPDGTSPPTTDKDEVEALEVQSRALNFVMRSLAKKLLANRKLLVFCLLGTCTGLGVTIGALSDIVYASKSSLFTLTLNKLGSCATDGGLWTLPHLKLLLESGESLDAQTALIRGFAAGLFENSQDGLTKFWQRLENLSLLPFESLMATKRLLIHTWREKLLEELRRESTPQASAAAAAQRRSKL